MPNPDIGLIVCPCCEFPAAHVRETVKKKTYIVCDECSSQTFARGSASDASIRRRMIPIVDVPATPVVQPDPAPDTPPPLKHKPKKEKGLAAWLNL